MNSDVFNPIRRSLKKGLTASRFDQSIFNKYSKGKISLEECMSSFFYNNGVKEKDREKITEEMFKAWLYSEGYGLL